jgi:site-specific recombinase XerD
MSAALAGQRTPIGASRVTAGTIRALAVSYSSVDFRSMKSSTQGVYRNIIERFCREVDKDGNAYGDKSVLTLRREHILKLMAARAEQPDSANGIRKVLRAMMKHAVGVGLRADDPTRDVRAIRVKSDGFLSWTDEEISQLEAWRPIGSRARLALALLLYTGQRRSDVVRMGRQCAMAYCR